MTRYPAAALTGFAEALLRASGLEWRHAATFAEALVGAELLDRGSHGLALLPRYLGDLEAGRTARSGDPVAVTQGAAHALLDGGMLPGPVVMAAAIDRALAIVAEHAVATVVVRRAQHIGCLALYLEQATARGALVLLCSSNPGARVVAPFGGVRAAYSPNPIACGIPTQGDPILIDFSSSAVAANACREYALRGEELPGPLLIGPDGQPTRDASVLFADPAGAILPLGGAEGGHKGFALGLMVEALTAGLGGFGRSSPDAGYSNAVLLLLFDPDRFGGAGFLRQEMSALGASCRASGDVRLPGERALAYRREALRDGLALNPATVRALEPWAERLGVAAPDPT